MGKVFFADIHTPPEAELLMMIKRHIRQGVKQRP